MNFMLGIMYLQTIQTAFPGGAQQFQADGGDVGVASLPGAPEEVFVYHPSLPSEVREILEKTTESINKKLRIEIHFVDQPNFGGHIDDETIRNVSETLATHELGVGAGDIKVAAALTISVCTFRVLNKRTDHPAIPVLKERIESIDGLLRAFILCDDGFVRVEQGSKKVKLDIQRPQRDNVIGQDDVTNLRIALGKDMDVNDIIEGL